MRFARVFVSLIALGYLTGCSISLDMPELGVNAMPTPGEQRSIFDSIFKITQGMKVSGPVEVSEVGPNEAQSGPEKWTVCARGVFLGELRYYTFFVRGSSVIDNRAAVVNDKCEARVFSPLAQPR
jgi:hypothetical protein